MGKSPDTSTITVTNGRSRATIPKPIAEALSLATGTKVRWRVTGKDRLDAQVVRDAESLRKKPGKP